MTFTKEEQKQIKKSRKTIVKDMRKLFNMYPYEKIEIPVNIHLAPKYGSYWYLVITKNRIAIKSDRGAYTNLYPVILPQNKDDRDNAHFQFISQYDSVRSKLVAIINEKLARKEGNLEKMTTVSEKYTKSGQKKQKKLEATVQIDIPKTQNVHEIKISEENGLKVGIIDFGRQTIKIITEGDIVLVDKNKIDNKVKKKEFQG